ncbi:DUF393 domain-containing protein [Pelomonas sp. APW6]|uniref:DUF393 domain-containing protein n=1 Tax=Roseateles subflavus TaxID=3053353 RepID=A0ABT7LNC4_9BURK|nr:DUF393 domain-containing protein [Pelomonas sp. APW6]MDL5033195.1 DUF393 domain-containing protein [Pelomonas sp. APW6]
MESSLYPLTIYFDGSCQLCSAEIENLRLRDTQGRLRFVDCSPADFVSPVPGADRTALMNVIHGVGAQGQVLRAVDLFEAAYRAVGLPWVSRLMTHPLVRPLADRAYPWIVRNRYRLPRSLIRGLFERAARQAAERAASQPRCRDGACERSTEPRS